MKILNTIALLLLSSALFAQEQTIKINMNTDKALLQRSMYAYAEFTKGVVHLKGNTTEEARLNYSRLNDEMLFIGNKNDTLALSNPETVENVIIGTDVYFYLGGTFVKQLTAYPTVNLELKSRLKYIGMEKRGDGYGATSNASSNESFTNVKNGTAPRLDPYANLTYTLSNTYYLYNGKNLVPATKKTFVKSFSKHEQEIENYIKTQTINFEKQADVEKLLQYIVSLN
jgi:hypothetical protein